MGGEDVTAMDCLDLWIAANKHFPKLAEIYGGVSGAFGKLPENDEYRFKRFQVGPPTTDQASELTPYPFAETNSLEGGGQGPVFPKYRQLKEELDAIFSRTIENLNDTGKALNRAAWAYSETDGLNSDDLKDYIDVSEGYKNADGEIVDKEKKPEYND